MNAREKDAHPDLCRRLATALAERDAARAEVERLRAEVTDHLDGIPIWGPHPDDGRMYLDVAKDDMVHDFRRILTAAPPQQRVRTR